MRLPAPIAVISLMSWSNRMLSCGKKLIAEDQLSFEESQFDVDSFVMELRDRVHKLPDAIVRRRMLQGIEMAVRRSPYSRVSSSRTREICLFEYETVPRAGNPESSGHSPLPPPASHHCNRILGRRAQLTRTGATNDSSFARKIFEHR